MFMELSRRIVHAIAYLNPTGTLAALEPLCWNWWDKYADKTGRDKTESIWVESKSDEWTFATQQKVAKRWSGKQFDPFNAEKEVE